MRAAGRRSTLARLGAVSLAAAWLPGCGFQLRGATTMPFRTLFVSYPGHSSVAPELLHALRRVPDLKLVTNPREAEARLEVLGESRQKEIIAFSPSGQPREYEIRLLFGWRLLDDQADEWIPTTNMVLRRTVTTTDAQLAAKPLEEAILYRDMVGDLVGQLMRRLAAARR